MPDGLSVSSVGSWALQHRPLICRSRELSTELSVSSVGSWALQPSLIAHRQRLPNSLSVSSVGSWALQPDAAATPCRTSHPALSVSSVGSWALQPTYVVSSAALLPTPFSILGRIVGTATRYDSACKPCGLDFQYPRSDRGHCNTSRIADARLCTDFQYPRSDRGHCNIAAM